MARWLLDDGPFDGLARHSGHLDLTAADCQLLVSSATARAAGTSAGRLELLELTRPDGSRLVEVFEVLLEGDDAAGQVFTELHREERTTLNEAEREAIAWALVHDSEAVFVTADKRAALIALAELGRERVAHPFDLWLELRDGGGVAAEAFQSLCTATRNADQGLERMPDRVVRFFRGTD